MVGVNPWTRLPSQAPYVLEQDKVPIVRFNATAAERVRIHTELLPEPYFGSLDAAVVFLGLNPGFKGSDGAVHLRPDFIEACRRNLIHQALEYPFLYLDPRFIETPGGRWWMTNLQPLLDEGIELEALSQHIMCVEWFPYHSPRFQALPTLVPSQHYSFGLVAHAIGRDALIIIMRAKGKWLESVPGLAGYRRRRALKSNRNVVVSRRNYGGDFVGLVDLLRSLPYEKPSRMKKRADESRNDLLEFAAALIGTTHTTGRNVVVRSSSRLRLEIAADGSGAIAVHLCSDDISLSRWLAMLDKGDGPRPLVARAESYEAPAAPHWRYGFIWMGRAGRDYKAERANIRAFVGFLKPIAMEKGAYFV